MTDLENPITGSQFRALHVWCAMLADTLNEQGITRRAVYDHMKREGVELPWSKETVKEVVKVVIHHLRGLDSTTEMSTTDPDAMLMVLAKYFGEFGVQVPPWPDNRRGPG